MGFDPLSPDAAWDLHVLRAVKHQNLSESLKMSQTHKPCQTISNLCVANMRDKVKPFISTNVMELLIPDMAIIISKGMGIE